MRDKIDFRNFDIRGASVADAAALANGKVDVIFNLACPASPPHYQKDPVYTWETSVLGIRNMLLIAEAQGARLLHASTSEIYGDPQVHPQPEQYWGNVNTVGVCSCYDEGKRAAETICADYRRFKNVDARLFRIFNTYGEFMHPDDGRVISNFCVAALKGESVPIYGNGEQTRSFCYVTDLIDGLIRMMATSADFTGPVNIGNPVEFTIIELAEKVLKLVGSHSKLVFKPLPADDPKQRQPNIKLAKANLDWHPSVTLEDGLIETIAYFRKLIAF